MTRVEIAPRIGASAQAGYRRDLPRRHASDVSGLGDARLDAGAGTRVGMTRVQHISPLTCGYCQKRRAPFRKSEWVAYAKPPYSDPEAVQARLSRSTHRVAISNTLLISADRRTVVVRWKDSRIASGANHERTPKDPAAGHTRVHPAFRDPCSAPSAAGAGHMTHHLSFGTNNCRLPAVPVTAHFARPPSARYTVAFKPDHSALLIPSRAFAPRLRHQTFLQPPAVVYWLINDETKPDQLMQSEAGYAPDIFPKKGEHLIFPLGDLPCSWQDQF